jgi:hypothetical protein
MALTGAALVGPARADPARVHVAGQLVDTWCSVTGIMFAAGTYYMVLRIEDDDVSAANPRLVKIQSHEVSVDGDLVERDGVKYLFVTKVADDKGIVDLTHDQYGIVPFGN